MKPASSSRRRRRQQGAGERPTRLASSWLEMRASAWSCSRMRRSRRSRLRFMAIILPNMGVKAKFQQDNFGTPGISCAIAHPRNSMAAPAAAITSLENGTPSSAGQTDWRRVTRLVQLSRALDDIEETKLVPQRKVLYQFSARGHEFAQILLGLNLTDPCDGVTVYYRSRPLMLTLGVDLEDAAAAPLARTGSFSGGRDIGVVFNMPSHDGPTVLPACGGVGAQYTPAAGWAQAIRYRREELLDSTYSRSIAVVLGG